ncbi:hypothetical protein ABGB07_02375 [Micromonosporaceae bacterium B7E4]
MLLDLGCIAMGLGGIWQQTFRVPPGDASEAVLIACVSILAYPAGAGVAQVLRSGTPTSDSGSPGQGSPQPASSSPSGNTGAGEP